MELGKLHLNHLYLAVEALNYLQLEGFFDAHGDWYGRRDEVEKARTGLRTEILRREQRAAKKAEGQHGSA